MTFDELLEVVSKAYDADGTILQARQSEDAEDVGDTLAVFIIRELGDTFEDDQPEERQLAEAARVIRNAQKQLDNVVAALDDQRS